MINIENKRIFIFGETHSNIDEIHEYFDLIKVIKPDFYLHELAIEDKCLSNRVLRERLRNCDKENLCDSRFNKFIYEFALENDLKLIGIDLDMSFDRMSLKQQFQLREEHMLRTIRYYDNMGYKICVQLGDTHIRSIKTTILGPISPIYEFYRDREDCLIIRSKTKEID